MSPHFLYRASGMALLVGSISGLLWTLISAFIVPLVTPDPYGNPIFLIASLFLLIAAILISSGLVGLYVSQSARVGWLGFAGFVLLFVGTLLLGVGFGFISTSVLPWITTHAPELLVGSLPPLLYFFALVGALLIVLGAIALGIAMILAKNRPLWPALALVLAGVAGLLGLLPLPTSKNIPAILSAALLFIGLGWSGYIQWKEADPVVETMAADVVEAMPQVQVETPQVEEVTPE